ncbi:MAG: hypothetical protein KGP12_04375 [Actinomycetales bacterium]|nr:hypothetical protein [Actinomycetales bacterium]
MRVAKADGRGFSFDIRWVVAVVLALAVTAQGLLPLDAAAAETMGTVELHVLVCAPNSNLYKVGQMGRCLNRQLVRVPNGPPPPGDASLRFCDNIDQPLTVSTVVVGATDWVNAEQVVSGSVQATVLRADGTPVQSAASPIVPGLYNLPEYGNLAGGHPSPIALSPLKAGTYQLRVDYLAKGGQTLYEPTPDGPKPHDVTWLPSSALVSVDVASCSDAPRVAKASGKPPRLNLTVASCSEGIEYQWRAFSGAADVPLLDPGRGCSSSVLSVVNGKRVTKVSVTRTTFRGYPGSTTETLISGEPDFDWEIPVRFDDTDRDHDGWIDYFPPTDHPPSPALVPNALTMLLKPKGLDPGTPDANCTWKIERPDGVVMIRPGCDPGPKGVQVPIEGDYQVTLRVKDPATGEIVASPTRKVPIDDVVIVSLGDSYASGEGVPESTSSRRVGDVPIAAEVWQVDAEVWQVDTCHTSGMAGVAQAAGRLGRELYDRPKAPETVTFLHLACSGAKAKEGVLGPYWGLNGTAALPSQISQIPKILKRRVSDIDVVTLNIGGNDLDFSPLFEDCLLPYSHATNCNPLSLYNYIDTLDTSRNVPENLRLVSICLGNELKDPGTFFVLPQLRSILEQALVANRSRLAAALEKCHSQYLGYSLEVENPDDFITKPLRQMILDFKMKQLKVSFAKIAERLSNVGGENLNGRVIVTQLPWLTRDDHNSLCQENQGPLTGLDLAMSTQDWAWIDDNIPKANALIAQAAKQHGWTVEGRQAIAFQSHGLCANDSFLVRINPYEATRNKFGMIHPNEKGQQAYADALYAAITGMLRKREAG